MIQLEIRRDGAPLGCEVSNDLTITGIVPGSPTDREGTLRPGDRIREINGVDLTHIPRQR